MEMKDYREYISADILMGPDSARILKELLDRHLLRPGKDDTILDLGCGKGLTSLVLARETGAKVCAVDLWIGAEENAERFAKWGVDGQVTPVHVDANELHFDKGIFRALVSVDSYHYFGGEPGFFEQKILPFLADGAEVLIGIPGIRNAFLFTLLYSSSNAPM